MIKQHVEKQVIITLIDLIGQRSRAGLGRGGLDSLVLDLPKGADELGLAYGSLGLWWWQQ